MMNNTSERLDFVCKQIAYEEGLRLKAYLCPAGKKTIGYGHNMETGPYFEGKLIPDLINRDQAEAIMLHDVEQVHEALLKKWPPYSNLSTTRQDACINMAFQLGVSGFMKFQMMRHALEEAQWYTATNEALNSQWAKQTVSRAQRVVTQFVTNKHYTIPDAH